FGVYAPGLEFSPDGRLLLARYGDTRVAVWDLETARAVLQIEMPPGPSATSAQLFTPDSRRLLIGLGDRSLRTYDLSTGEEVGRLTLEASVAAMALHPNGNAIAISGWNQTNVQVL